MKPIDVAIDDYMHVIARTRPWSMRREEELLEVFSEWLYEQPEPRVMLNEIVPEQVQHFVAAAEWNEEDQQELIDVLNNLYLWSGKQGWVVVNPFEGVTA